ncbi:MAG: hypothetical protein V3R16_02435 [Nitrospirales bacterium]
MRNLLTFLASLCLAWPSLAADCDAVGPRRSITPMYEIQCRYLADSATTTGARTTCTTEVMENVDEWYFFTSEDTGVTDMVVDIENFFEVDDDPTVICTLTDENPECRWIRRLDGNLHKSLRANITTLTGPSTDTDIQVCFIRYIHQ